MSVNIARLLTTYNFEIDQLPDDLKCAQCKLVLKEASQVPCGCTFCRVCIDDMMLGGREFCPGGSEDCGKSLLSSYQSDYSSNRRVLKLIVKCPHDGCEHECRLENMEEHLRECPRKGEECPFRELGCTQDKLAAEEMGGHLQHDNRRHSEILIRMIANINRKIESLELRDVVNTREIETLKGRDEASSRKIEMLNERDKVSIRVIDRLKGRNEVSCRMIETLKHELMLKDEHIKSIMDQIIQVPNEIESIKEEKEQLGCRLRILTENIERVIGENRQNDELDMVRLIEHVDREIAAVKRLIGSNNDEPVIDIQSERYNIGSMNQEVKLIKEDICPVKMLLESIQALVGLGQDVASLEWLIDDDVGQALWTPIHSKYFTIDAHQYTYRLSSWNVGVGIGGTALCIRLHIYAGPNDGQFAWLFAGRVVITVTDRDRREVCRSISRQCRIERPPHNECSWSDPFRLRHSELRRAGLNLSRGVCMWCVIVPGAG